MFKEVIAAHSASWHCNWPKSNLENEHENHPFQSEKKRPKQTKISTEKASHTPGLEFAAKFGEIPKGRARAALLL